MLECIGISHRRRPLPPATRASLRHRHQRRHTREETQQLEERERPAAPESLVKAAGIPAAPQRPYSLMLANGSPRHRPQDGRWRLQRRRLASVGSEDRS